MPRVYSATRGGERLRHEPPSSSFSSRGLPLPFSPSSLPSFSTFSSCPAFSSRDAAVWCEGDGPVRSVSLSDGCVSNGKLVFCVFGCVFRTCVLCCVLIYVLYWYVIGYVWLDMSYRCVLWRETQVGHPHVSQHTERVSSLCVSCLCLCAVNPVFLYQCHPFLSKLLVIMCDMCCQGCYYVCDEGLAQCVIDTTLSTYDTTHADGSESLSLVTFVLFVVLLIVY